MKPFRELMENANPITKAQLKEFERLLDKLFEKFDIDFEFTKHFHERLNSDRNNPDITLRELASFMQKIYRKQGKSLKALPDAEAVIRDLQTDLNIPLVIDYKRDKDEFEIRMKTIMRKKNFKTPDKMISFK